MPLLFIKNITHKGGKEITPFPREGEGSGMGANTPFPREGEGLGIGAEGSGMGAERSGIGAVAVWKITESPEELKEMAVLDQSEEELYASFKSLVRKKQWLSYRILLQQMLAPGDSLLKYDEYGKPHLKNKSHNLSVSHSGEYAAVITSNTVEVGIDIEQLKDRIFRISDKFLSAEEEKNLGESNRLEKLYIIWGAKEALYKCYGKPEVEFSRDIFLDSFDYLCSGEGMCNARMKTPEGLEDYAVFYEKIAGYMLVWALKK